MAGHSRWANIKHKKTKSDAAKGKIFSRLAKEIITAVKLGGASLETNARLRLVVQKAKLANMPHDNIEKNIHKASSADQAAFSEVIYEIYGYNGVGLMVEISTDNKNRIASDIRTITNKHGGSIAAPGSVAFNFEQKGKIRIDQTQGKSDDLFNLAIEAGAENFEEVESFYEITTSPEDLYAVKEAFDKANILCKDAQLERIPKTYINCDEEALKANLNLIDYLEDLDDVNAVYHNMEASDELMQKIS